VDVAYSLIGEDLVVLQPDRLVHCPELRRFGTRVTLALAPASSVASSYCLLHSNVSSTRVCFLLPLCLLLPLYFGYLILKRQLLGVRRLRITPESLNLFTGQKKVVTVDWKALISIVVTGEHAFFYLPNRSGYVLPKRAFASEREFEDFMTTARRYHDACYANP
jgi:YcxB-like protein